MTVDLDTTWLGDGDCSADQIVAAISAAGTPAYPADTVRAIAVAIVHWCDVFNLRPSAVAGQIAHETGWLQFGGDVRPEQNNYAGLGATGGVPGASFATVDDGVRAVLAHHLVYLYGPVENWPHHLREYRMLDPRYQAVLDAGYGGTVRTIGDYTNGRWAYSRDVPVGSLENGYARGIVRAANAILSQTSTEQEQTMATIPTEADLGYPVRVVWAADQGPRRSISSIIWFIVHKTEGREAGDIPTLTQPTNPVASCHLWIRRDGHAVFMVPLDITAWTSGNQVVDELAINVELEGFVRESTTEAQYRCLAAFYRWCVRQGAPIPPEFVGYEDRPGIFGHQHVADPDDPGMWGGFANHTDPGERFDWTRLIAYIRQAGTSSEPDPCLSFDAVPYRICHGFKAFWEKYGGLPIFGYPITDEMQEGGRTVQYFERARFEHHPGSSADMFDVMLGLIGTELLESRAAQD